MAKIRFGKRREGERKYELRFYFIDIDIVIFISPIQADDVKNIFLSQKKDDVPVFKYIDLHKDLQNIERCIVFQKIN